MPNLWKDLISINRKQRLYLVDCDKGYTCMGYDYAKQRTRGVLDWLGDTTTRIPRSGSIKAYRVYRKTMARGAIHSQRAGRCPVELTPQLDGLEGKRVEVVDCYGATRRFKVEKSTGWMPCHLELARRDSSGGPGAMGTPYRSIRVV